MTCHINYDLKFAFFTQEIADLLKTISVSKFRKRVRINKQYENKEDVGLKSKSRYFPRTLAGHLIILKARK